MSGTAELVSDPSEPKTEERQATAHLFIASNSAADPPPDGGYGWVCVASVFIINGFTWGVSAVRSKEFTYHLSKHHGLEPCCL